MMTFVANDAEFGLFGFVCLTAALLITIAELLMLHFRRHLLVRPSMQVACLYTIFFMWPMTVFAPNLALWLPDPYAFMMVIVIFITSLLLFNLLTLQQTTLEIWRRATAPESAQTGRMMPMVVLLTAISAVIMFGYFRQVPLTQTGLIIALVDPSDASMAREESLKLLDDALTKYTYSIFASGIGPLLGVLLAWCVIQAARTRRYLGMLVAAVMFAVVLISLSITGARSFAVSTLLAVLIAALFRRGFHMRVLPVVLSAMVVILPAVVLTVFREGRGFAFDLLMEQISAVVIERVFVSPLEVGAAYVHLAQTHGYLGIEAVPKLSQLWMGSPGVDVPNAIGLSYFWFGSDQINANAGFVATYFSYFGPIGLVISIICAMSLDLVLLSYRWIGDRLLVPCMAVLAAAMFALLSVDFTVILLTYGFVVVPAIAVVLTLFTQGIKARAGRAST